MVKIQFSKNSMTKQRDDYDNPWKMAIATHFESLLAFFFPEIHQNIDWNKPYEFLDKELQQVMREDEIGKREADKLVKVWLLDGTETWVLLHLEVQSQYKANFAERMYVYNSRIFGLYRKKVVSLAILADDEPSWRPTKYSYTIFGCRVLLEFPIVKLLDYEQNWSELEQNPNPFAIIVMAHLKTQTTRKLPQERLNWKLSIFKNLYQKGYNKKQIRELIRVIDWMMILPKNLKNNFELEIKSYQEENKMPYVTSFERTAREDDIIMILETRFNADHNELIKILEPIDDDQQLRFLLKEAITINSVADFSELVKSLDIKKDDI